MSENSVPLNPMVLLIIIPIKWLFHWEYTLFSDKPIYFHEKNLQICPMQLNHGAMARVNEELQGSRAAALRCPPGLGAHSTGGRWGTKKSCVFLLENLVKFGKFQQNLEKWFKKTWDVPT